MMDAQMAWKAAKVAAIALGGILLFVFLVVGFFVLAYELLGGIGAAAIYIALLFLVFFFLAAVDINRAEDRKAQPTDGGGEG